MNEVDGCRLRFVVLEDDGKLSFGDGLRDTRVRSNMFFSLSEP